MSKSLDQVNVEDVMARDVVYVNPADTLDEALDVLVENHVSALPVIDGNRRCVGFLSITDVLGLARDYEEVFSELPSQAAEAHSALLQRLRQPDLGNQLVQELMTEATFTVKPTDTLSQAAKEMHRHKVHRLAVVKEDGQLLGIVSTMDIIGALGGD